jgi:hypothetical protein
MKKLLVLFIIVLPVIAFAQADTLKVEQYCEVVATSRMFSKKVTIDIDYGEARSIWKDNRLKDEDGNLKKFNTTIDALNYLGKQGWKLVNAFPMSEGSTTNSVSIYHFYFKREFVKSQTDAGANQAN